MAEIKQGRWMADIEGDFVVFLIGARLSKRHLLRSFLDLGGRRGMMHMLDVLSKDPDKGLLGFQAYPPSLTIAQYWRSFEHLERFANDTEDPHVAAWRGYWKRVGRGDRTGIWHETFLVKAGEYEAIYGNMPPYGLGKASSLVTLAEGVGSRDRLKRRAAGRSAS